MPNVNICHKRNIGGTRRALVTLRVGAEDGSAPLQEFETVLVGSEPDGLYRCVEAVCPHSGELSFAPFWVVSIPNT